MKLSLYQVDAFTDELFHGNPAAVVPLEEWLEDELMQSIAAENNLSETAFFVPEDDGWHLRWFTPAAEVDLCGHATLASAWVLFHEIAADRDEVRFRTRSGELSVSRGAAGLEMDFPARPPEPRDDPPRALIEGLGEEPDEVLAAKRDYLVVYGSEEQVRKLKPDFHRLRTVDRLGVIVTAEGVAYDFVSRFFAPSVGVPEDPVTGSAHCTLVPYWAERLGRDGSDEPLRARQVSARRGTLLCRYRGDRVSIGGRAVLYLKGTIHL